MLRWNEPPRRGRSALLAALLLTGCAAGPSFVAPNVDSPPSWTATSGGAGQLTQDAQSSAVPPSGPWWESLRSPRLNATIREALAHNRDLAAARATLTQLSDLAAASEGGEYPQVDLQGSAGREKYGAAFLGPEKLPAFTFYSVGFGVSYLFDFAGGVRRTIEQQRALAEAQQREVDAAVLALSGNVARQALLAASARAQIESVEALLADDAQNLKLVRDAFEAGSATRVDELNAQSQLANDQTQLPALRRQLRLAENALALLVGHAPADWVAPDFRLSEFTLPTSVPQMLPAELAHRRPDILAAEARLHASTAAAGIAAANLYPQITLTASASLQSTVLHNLFGSGSGADGLSASLTQPLFDHGSLRARERAARQALQASLDHYEQVVLQSFGQVADALDSLEHDQELIQSEQSALSVSNDSLGLTRESYMAGNTGVLQVLEAQRQNQQARLGLVRAQAQQYQDSVDLQLALGGRIPSG
jgi:NodT family efflux transporter outer membrane factor (OMF) lipoprotein